MLWFEDGLGDAIMYYPMEEHKGFGEFPYGYAYCPYCGQYLVKKEKVEGE